MGTLDIMLARTNPSVLRECRKSDMQIVYREWGTNPLKLGIYIQKGMWLC